MARNPLHDVAIVGAYNTVQARQIQGMTEFELLLDAMKGALRSAGMKPSDVDGVNVRSSVWHANPRETAHWLGGRPTWTGGRKGRVSPSFCPRTWSLRTRSRRAPRRGL